MKIFILTVVLVIIICGCGKKEEISYPDRVTKPEEERFVLEETFMEERPKPSFPLYIYRPFKRRDPFVPLIQKKEEKKEEVLIEAEGISERDIGKWALVGIIWDRKEAVALLSSGDDFGYILKNGRLLGEDNRPVEGIFGQIIGDDCVILTQGGRRITLYLRGG